ncbi:MAG: BNR-4 repeat-containing protein [Opitutaceae bacterium]
MTHSRTVVTVVLLLTSTWLSLARAATHEPVLLSSEASGRATAYLESGKIVTFQGRTHVTWLDTPPEGFRIRIRTLDHRTGQWSQTWTVGEAADNHGGPALTVDQAGYLHLVFYSHHHPFRYRRSLRPNDASEWSPVEEFGLHLTYPTLLCAADGTLILSARHSFDDKPWELELWTKPPSGAWVRREALLRSRTLRYAQFAASMAWGPDHRKLYLSYRIYEMPDYEKKDAITGVGCIVSPDAGVTWTRLDGKSLALPATLDTQDAIITCNSREGRIADSGSMAVSPAGVPHLTYSVRVQENAEAYLATPLPGGGWRHLKLNSFLPEELRNHALILQGGVVFTADGQPVVVCTALRYRFDEEPWGHPTNRLVVFSSRDGGLTFSSRVLSTPQGLSPQWLPNLEKPTGFNEVPARPGVIFTAGDAGAGLKDVLRNQVWWQQVP